MADATVRVTVRKQKTQNALDRILMAADEFTADAVDMVTDETKINTVRLLTRLSHPRGTPTPSAPGEPPAKISGDLFRSVEATEARRVEEWTWSAQVGPTDPPPYGRIQELGGATGRGHRTHLLPRPYMSKAVEELMALAFYEDTYRRMWHEALKAGTG